ncbi:hypothetical protein OBJ99_04950 [Empedobacter falsenii]
MKTFLKSKFLFILILFFSTVNTIYAQDCPDPSWGCDGGGGGGTPPTPGQGLGNPATPIDQYTIYLIRFAIAVAVVYFAMNKYKKSLI